MSLPGRSSIVVLHGAMGAASVMQPLVEEFEPYAHATAINLLGHGGRPLPQRLSIPDMVDDVLEQIGPTDAGSTFVFGYSAGALVALQLARHHARHFAGVCTLAAKYVFDQQTIAHWTHASNPERLLRPELKRADVLTERHAPRDWVPLAAEVCRMFQDWAAHPPITTDDLRAISLPALMFCSDKDQLVSVDEARALGALVPNSRVVFFRGQSHPLEVVPVAPMAKATGDWMNDVRSKAPAPSSAT